MALLSLLSTNELVAQIVCFLIMLTIMRVFLWKKFLGVLDKRREMISAELKSIEDTKESAMKLRREYETHLSRIDEERRAKIEEASIEARRISDGIIAKAQGDGEKLLEKARFNLQDDIARARLTMKNDIVDIAIQAAEKVVQERLSESSDRRIVEDFIDGINKK